MYKEQPYSQRNKGKPVKWLYKQGIGKNSDICKTEQVGEVADGTRIIMKNKQDRCLEKPK